MQYHKTVLGILWQIMDIVHEQKNNGSGVPTLDILLARFVPFKDMEDKWDTFAVKQLIEMGLNCVHEATHSLYIKRVYNGTIAGTFLGDDLFGANRTISIEVRVDNVAKRVQNITEATKATMGQSGRGGNTFGRRGGGRRGEFSNNYNGGRHPQYNG